MYHTHKFSWFYLKETMSDIANDDYYTKLIYASNSNKFNQSSHRSVSLFKRAQPNPPPPSPSPREKHRPRDRPEHGRQQFQLQQRQLRQQVLQLHRTCGLLLGHHQGARSAAPHSERWTDHETDSSA